MDLINLVSYAVQFLLLCIFKFIKPYDSCDAETNFSIIIFYLIIYDNILIWKIQNYGINK